MVHTSPCRRFVVGVIYLQFESKENKIIIESFSRVYVEPLEEYGKAHAWKACIHLKSLRFRIQIYDINTKVGL